MDRVKEAEEAAGASLRAVLGEELANKLCLQKADGATTLVCMGCTFRLESKLGEGGQGHVFRVASDEYAASSRTEDEKLCRSFALKVTPLREGEGTQAAVREAEIHKHLSAKSSFVVRALEWAIVEAERKRISGKEKKRKAVLQLLELGECSLMRHVFPTHQDFIAKRPRKMDFWATVGIFRDMAQALLAAHRNDVLHLDVLLG